MSTENSHLPAKLSSEEPRAPATSPLHPADHLRRKSRTFRAELFRENKRAAHEANVSKPGKTSQAVAPTNIRAKALQEMQANGIRQDIKG